MTEITALAPLYTPTTDHTATVASREKPYILNSPVGFVSRLSIFCTDINNNRGLEPAQTDFGRSNPHLFIY